MANTLILVDRRDDPWRKATVTLSWKGGGYSKVWVDDSGRGAFSGSGVVMEAQVAGEKIPVYRPVNGSTTIVVKSDRAH
ncbi:MAG: hypothetical protein GYA52_01710 [Chloroflexi bacterium]|jgi:hypothetical protein|nr:hypothetical protein [Chloroflexota bacterium]